MTKEEFVTAFVKEAKGFFTLYGDRLRSKDAESQCPICWLARMRDLGNFGNYKYRIAAEHLGIDPKDAVLLAEASDYTFPPIGAWDLKRTRKELLECLS